MKKIVFSILTSLLLTVALTSCAAGAATAAYSVKAQSADSLSSEAEHRIIQRAKSEIMAEISKSTASMNQEQ